MHCFETHGTKKLASGYCLRVPSLGTKTAALISGLSCNPDADNSTERRYEDPPGTSNESLARPALIFLALLPLQAAKVE